MKMIIAMTTENKNNEQSKPKFMRIDKYYWLNKGFEMVDGGLSRVHKQISTVNTYINGLLGIYVLATVIDAIYSEIDSVVMLLIVIAPVLIVKIAAFYGNISVIPEAKSFYPDSAQSSEATYYQFLRDARAHLTKLKKFAAWSTGILLSVLVIVTWLTVESKQKAYMENNELIKTKKTLATTKASLDSIKKLATYNFNAKYLKNVKKLLLEGTFPENSAVEVLLFDVNHDTINKPEHLLIGGSGRLYHSMILNSKPEKLDKVIVKFSYSTLDGDKRTITKNVPVKD